MTTDPSDQSFDPNHLSNLSAEELVDRLSVEMDLVDELDEASEDTSGDALANLLFELQVRATPKATEKELSVDKLRELLEEPTPENLLEVISQLECVMTQLNEYAMKLEDRSQEIARRENQLNGAGESLVSFQQQLIQQLDQIQQSLEKTSHDEGDERSVA